MDMTERFNTCVKYASRKWDAGEIIKDKLWIGSVQDAKNFEELKKRKIDTMLTAGTTSLTHSNTNTKTPTLEHQPEDCTYSVRARRIGLTLSRNGWF